jgi:hypothetical protein
VPVRDGEQCRIGLQPVPRDDCAWPVKSATAWECFKVNLVIFCFRLGKGREAVIHHLRPVADFDFRRKKEHVYVVNHWPNLRPLSQMENVARADTIHDDDIRQLEANIRKARMLGLPVRRPWVHGVGVDQHRRHRRLEGSPIVENEHPATALLQTILYGCPSSLFSCRYGFLELP